MPTPTVAVTDHGQRREAEDATALDHLGHAVDGDHLLAQAVVALFVLHALHASACIVVLAIGWIRLLPSRIRT
jgi:hypothetical protein